MGLSEAEYNEYIEEINRRFLDSVAPDEDEDGD